MARTGKFFYLGFLLVALFACSGRASNVLELESTYLGSGQFQYRLKLRPNPFVPLIGVQQFDATFTNRQTYLSMPANWNTTISQYGNNGAAWVYAGNPVQTTNLEQVFLVQSSQTAYRMGSVVITFDYGLNTLIAGPVEPGSIGVGNLVFPCLQPCAPAEVDGSPTNFTGGFEFVPDIKINQLNLSGTNVMGLTYVWNKAASTMQVEASNDLKTWAPVAQIYGPTGTNTWTSAAPLNDLGKFFRLSLLGLGQVGSPQLLSLASGTGGEFSSGQASVAVNKCTRIADGMSVEISTVPSGRYCITLSDLSGAMEQSQEVIATGSSETVIFKADNLPNPALVRAVRLD